MSERPRPDAPPGDDPERERADEPFLKRWSRLKADSAAATAPPAPPAAPEHDQQQAPEAPAEPEALPPGDEDMPPLEALGEDSDFSGFMSPRVSAALRKQALRKLFRSPKFNVISELDDYIDDYRNFPALGDLVTSDMKHAAAELLKKQLAAAEAEAVASAETGGAATDAAGAQAAGVAAGAADEAGEAEDHSPAAGNDDDPQDPDDTKEPTRDA